MFSETETLTVHLRESNVATHRSKVLIVPQAECMILQYFAPGTFMFAVADAEKLNKNVVCMAIHKVSCVLTELLNAF